MQTRSHRSTTIKVLIADDGTLFAESLRRVLEEMSSAIKVIAIAHNGRETVRRANELRPDVILMDVRMPELDGVAATAQILASLPQTRIIVLTNFDDDEYVKEAIGQGAAGYLLKDISPEHLVEAVEGANDQAIVLSPAVASKLAHDLTSSSSSNVPEWYANLSRREKEVLSCMARGQSNKEIAETLFLAEQTVRNHVSEIYSKTDIHNRMRLIDAVRRIVAG